MGGERYTPRKRASEQRAINKYALANKFRALALRLDELADRASMAEPSGLIALDNAAGRISSTIDVIEAP